jgi:hypothetical protein
MDVDPPPDEGGSGSGAAAGAGDADVLRVPALEAVAVAFPGYVRSVPRAMEALGGEREAAAALEARSGVLRLWLRPADPLSHPLFGERRRARGLVLRVARKRDDGAGAAADGEGGEGGGGGGGGGGESGGVSVSVAAVVRAAYHFSGLADYQYLPVDRRTASRAFAGLPDKNRPESAEVYRTPQPLLLVPPLFTRADVPGAFAFADGGGGDGARAAGAGGARWWSKAGRAGQTAPRAAAAAVRARCLLRVDPHGARVTHGRARPLLPPRPRRCWRRRRRRRRRGGRGRRRGGGAGDQLLQSGAAAAAAAAATVRRRRR